METLVQFIQSNDNPRELKRALAVQMSQRGYSYREIKEVLQVSVGFVTASQKRYQSQGVEGLKSHYRGTSGYLKVQQKQEVFDWLEQKDAWTIEEVISHIEDTYGVVYQSRQSYYALLKSAGFSWKKAHPTHPSKDAVQVEKKKPKLENCWCSDRQKLPTDRCECCL